jgi:hypothetical protein
MGSPTQGWSRRSARGAVLAAGLALAASSYPAATAAQTAATPPAHVLFRITAPQIDESSSLVNSGFHPGLLYTANDSGDGPYVYVLDHEGHLVGTTTLTHVDPVDIEALGGAQDGSLVVADIGDNRSNRATVTLYRIPQPTSGDHAVKPDKVTLTYPDGARNAESVAETPVAIPPRRILSTTGRPSDRSPYSSARPISNRSAVAR